MNSVHSVSWLDTHQWGVRAFNRGPRAVHNGFKFRRGWNRCPDWDTTPKCGGGFHIMTPQHHGFGFAGSQIALVEWRGEYIALRDKAKVSELRIIPCSRKVLIDALRRCKIIALSESRQSAIIGLGELCVVLSGLPRITQRGGEVWTYGASAPRITQSGGIVRTNSTSAPRITQSRGDVWTYGTSAPRIMLSGGMVLTYHTSAPRITQSGGVVWTYDQSRPRITRRNP